MKHSIKILMKRRDKHPGPILECRSRMFSAGLWRLLFGKRQQVVVLMPGSSVQAVDIVELPDSDTVIE